jgi:hypothetical protein
LRDVNDQLAVRASESSTLRELITQVVLGNKQVEGHMTRLRNLALGGLAALAIGGAATSAFANEPGGGGFNYLAGASNGIPSGASLPPGLYTGFTSAYGLVEPMTGNQGGGTSATNGGTKLGAFIGALPLVWSTGYNFLGASYSALVIQPFVTAIVVPAGGSSTTGIIAGQQMFLNTIWQPINLSWNLTNGWFVSVAFSFQGPDGTMAFGSANPDYWTFQPGLGISYLSANWNLSANLAYSIFTAASGTNSAITGYTAGNLFEGDTHALYKIGKWEIGPVADFDVQTTADSVCTTAYGCKQTAVYLGGLVGYDFGPVSLQVWAIDPVYAANTAQGATVFTRLGFKLWGPEAPKPLVAKN